MPTRNDVEKTQVIQRFTCKTCKKHVKDKNK